MRFFVTTSFVLALAPACSSTSTTKVEQTCGNPQGCDGSASTGTGASGSGGSGNGGTVATGGTGPASGGTSGIGGASASGGSGGSITDSGPDVTTADDVPIQRIQNGTIAVGSVVSVRSVFVTAAKTQTSTAYGFYVQEPQGQTSDGLVYPAYAGVAAFVDIDRVASLPLPAAGQCVDIAGTVAEFQGQTQIVISSIFITANCGLFPGALAVSASSANFADIATDADRAAAGDQPGAMAERYEGVLVRVDNVQAISTVSGTTFMVVDRFDPGGPTLTISEFYFAVSPAVGETFASITGVYGEFGNYRLQPRSAGDILR
jgi:hypothetical protein